VVDRTLTLLEKDITDMLLFIFPACLSIIYCYFASCLFLITIYFKDIAHSFLIRYQNCLTSNNLVRSPSKLWAKRLKGPPPGPPCTIFPPTYSERVSSQTIPEIVIAKNSDSFSSYEKLQHINLHAHSKFNLKN